MAARSHRQEGGNPTLEIIMRPTDVEWRLDDLDNGVPETVAGAPRVNRIDFYFRVEVLRNAFPSFPPARVSSNSTYRFPATNPVGQERPGGIDVRMVYPICRFSPIEEVDLYSQQPPAFRAYGADAILHLDMETGPASIYGEEIYEVHFGIEALYDVTPLAGGQPSYAVLHMSDVVYATIRSELSVIL